MQCIVLTCHMLQLFLSSCFVLNSMVGTLMCDATPTGSAWLAVLLRLVPF